MHAGRHVVRLVRAAAQAAAGGRGRRAVEGVVRALQPVARRAVRDRLAPPTIRTFSGLIERFGTGKGCDICKPAVASILASTSSEHILDGEQASLQDSNDHFLANIQKNGSYSVVPRVPGGDITPEQLILIGEIARDFDLYTKITGGQRIDMFGAPGRPAARDLAPAGRRRHGIRPRLRQGAAHGEELRGQRLVPLRPTGFGADGHRPRAALPRAARAAQDQDGRVGLRARMRRGARQGRRRHRHRDRLEPLRRRQRRHDAQARRSCWPAISTTRRWSATSTGS